LSDTNLARVGLARGVETVIGQAIRGADPNHPPDIHVTAILIGANSAVQASNGAIGVPLRGRGTISTGLTPSVPLVLICW
jgi:hypothetical protein